MLAILLLAGVSGISAVIPNNRELQFSARIRQNEHCEICYGSECLNLNQTRCEYYKQTDNMLWDGPEIVQAEDTEIRDRIDGYMMEYVHHESWTDAECIPLVSQYTNCHRENICTDCQSCNCDGMARWNCTTTQRCESTGSIDFNHTTMTVVIKKLNDYYINVLQRKKRKRSILHDDGTEKERVNYEDILKLLYGIENFEYNHTWNSTEESITPQYINDIGSNIWNTEPLRFEELLKSYDYDKNYILNFEDATLAKNTTFQNKTDANLNSTIYKRSQIKNNDIFYVKSVETPLFDYLNNFDDTRNLDKRETVSEPTEVQNNTLTTLHNSSTNSGELKNNILYPLFNVIYEKQKELGQLINIRDNLVIYFKSFTDINITSNATYNVRVKNNDPHLYFYQLEIPAETNDNFRKDNKNILQKYLNKLKRDLIEVIRDITNITKLSNSSRMPIDLKVLMQAIKYYGNKRKLSNKKTEPRLSYTNIRRRFDIYSHSKQYEPITVFNNIFKSLTAFEAELVIRALEPVSKGVKQILIRIIKYLLRDDFVNITSQTFDPEYDIVNLLNDTLSEWDRVIASVIKHSFLDPLYCMKLLHIEVSTGEKKIKLAIEQLHASKKQHTTLIEEAVGDRIISKIEDDLKRINQLVIQMVLNKKLNNNKFKMHKMKSDVSGSSQYNKISKRKSFLQSIKKLLRSSKRDIRDLFRKNVPKSHIIKHIAKEKMDEMTQKKFSEYAETMRRWKNNLNVRNKRSAGEIGNFFNRLKHIIPGYLRGKVHRKTGNKTKGVKRKLGHRTNKTLKYKSTTPLMYKHH